MKQICGSLIVILMFGFISMAQDISSNEGLSADTILQTNSTHPLLQDSSTIQDARIDTLLLRHVEINKRMIGVKGYRLEIFFSSDYDARGKALQVKTDFLTEYPDLEAYIQYQAPNFKVRIGNFRTKNEALKVKHRIKRHYPNAFRVDDEIDYPKLITEDRGNE